MIDTRRLAVALAGASAFIDLYATQSLLPTLGHQFHVGASEISLTVSIATLAVALVAPFAGLFADMAGRKKIIVSAALGVAAPTLMVALSASLPTMLVWRFIEGLFLPAIFAVTVAYVGEEWDRGEVASATSVYVAGTVMGGFLGRFVTGLVATWIGWRGAFGVLAAINLASGAAIWAWLPRERRFRKSGNLSETLRSMRAHLSNRPLLATYAVGAGVLFSLVGTFTYVNFRLAAPPYGLDSGALGMIFAVYLLGVVVTPLAGRWVERVGRRRMLGFAVVLSSCGLVATLGGPLWLIVLGLAVCSSGVFVSQAVATGQISLVAGHGRSSAVGLYVTCYYLGGSIGGVLPGIFWAEAGWPGCVAMMMAVQALALLVAWRFWPSEAALASHGQRAASRA